MFETRQRLQISLKVREPEERERRAVESNSLREATYCKNSFKATHRGDLHLASWTIFYPPYHLRASRCSRTQTGTPLGTHQ